ncbi:hypothetical protein KP509_1Z006300 [Ceratopteris richardii]|nr:hypothetical protein KP509_1Z006300 [Ceratopteris richardii]
MTGNFGIQINPELILKLTEPEKYERQKRIGVRKPSRTPSGLIPKEPRKPPQELPFQPFPLGPPAEAKPHVEKPLLDHHYEHGDDAALAPYRKVAAECERALESLRKQEITDREDVQRRAKEIQSKQYRPPERKPIPCLAEQKACTICLTENRSDPLKCQDVVKAYARCAEQVRQRFVTTGFGSPPVNN